MVCIYCHQETKVINSRLQKRTNTIWRRRRCLSCSTVFTTHELADYTALWRVSNDNLTLDPFSRDRLLVSLYKSLQHRSTALTDASGLADTVMSQLTPLTQDGLVTSALIAEVALSILQRFDSAAAIHYQAFHKL